MVPDNLFGVDLLGEGTCKLSQVLVTVSSFVESKSVSVKLAIDLGCYSWKDRTRVANSFGIGNLQYISR
jgi:hypothetical protein